MVHGSCTAVYRVPSQPYTAVYTGRKDDRVNGSCTAVYRVRTRREQPCTRAVNTLGYRVHGRVRVINGPCTRPVNGRVHGPYKAVQMGNGRGHGPYMITVYRP